MKHSSFRVNSLVGLLASITFVVPVLGVDGVPIWRQSVVSPAGADAFVTSPSLAFDHFGGPSVAWSRFSTIGGNNTVYRSELLGLGLWAHRSVASGFGLGAATSLSFDRAERPIVAWTTSGNEVHADFNNGQVTGLVGADAGGSGQALSISHDLAGNLRGVYCGADAGNLRSVDFDNVGFSSLSLTTVPGVQEIVDAQLVTDHVGLRHVIARAELPGGMEGVVVASEPSFPASWPVATLASAGSVGGVSVATNPANGRVGVAYSTTDGGTSRLVYAEMHDFALETTVLFQTSTSIYEDVSLAYDLSDGRPAIAFEENVLAGGESLSLAYVDGAQQWQTSLIDDSIRLDAPGAMLKPSLAFDDYGTSYPAVAYVDDDGALTVAFDPPAVPEPASFVLLLAAAAMIRGRGCRGWHWAD
ncbi:MAG: hypothetical protein H6818_14165 [Phycisphaerales bacterium]|nr:hypothetical protein [Phycisphaerales bacterium]MCB9862051.1 hypothetical protein [Phycisphaerales bacterium]